MTFTLPALPFEKDAFGNLMSHETFDYHYNKHHQTYVDKLNALIINTQFAEKSLEEIIKESAKDEKFTAIFNNAAQHYNHAFFWQCLSPKPIISANLIAKINQNFGSQENFKKAFVDAGISLFGSGWVWLVANNDEKLSIIKTSNAGTPITMGLKPILVCDVWEHAYYIDYRNQRQKYLETFINELANYNTEDDKN